MASARDSTAVEVSGQAGTRPADLPRVVHDVTALVLLVDLRSGEVTYANRLAEQVAPGVALPLSLTRARAAQRRRCRRGTLTYANAGHHAPMLRLPDGSVQRLDDSDDALIGAPIEATDDRTNATARLPRGSVLLLFTDGLVESRSRDLEAGLADVARVLSSLDPADGAEALVDALAALAVRQEADDDVCILAVRVR